MREIILAKNSDVERKVFLHDNGFIVFHETRSQGRGPHKVNRIRLTREEFAYIANEIRDEEASWTTTEA